MKKVKVEDSVGKRLAHDVVQYGPKLKAVQFKRGHVVGPDDVERLKDSGNYEVYVEEGEAAEVHEDEAALRMAAACGGENVTHSRPNKGKVNILAQNPGLLKVNSEAVRQVNMLEGFVMATRPNGSGVRKGQLLASVKIVPLSVDEGRMREAERILSEGRPVVNVVRPAVKSVGVIITGTEVHEERVKDAFLPKLQKKLGDFGVEVSESTVIPDDAGKIKKAIEDFRAGGKELILVCGGMAVDAGDVTSSAIKSTGAEVVFRGVPVFPGAMVMLAYLRGIPVMGLPACVIPDERTAFDKFLPKLLAKEKVGKEEAAELGHGGLL